MLAHVHSALRHATNELTRDLRGLGDARESAHIIAERADQLACGFFAATEPRQNAFKTFTSVTIPGRIARVEDAVGNEA